jgi:hypothetical protein
MGRSTIMGSLLALAVCAGHATAQTVSPPPDTLKVDYFTYANVKGAPDASVHLTNPGTTGGNICAAIYVFNPQEEITECCSCLLTPNGLRTLSVDNDVTGNPFTGVVQETGSFSIVSTPATGPESETCQLPTTLNPASGGVRAWATHIDRVRLDFHDGYTESSAPSPDATLSSEEQNELALLCDAIVLDGSGHGICTCGTGD